MTLGNKKVSLPRLRVITGENDVRFRGHNN
jgi:hypothetical protein